MSDAKESRNITSFDDLNRVEKDMVKKTPADFLEEIANIYRQRYPVYGDNYKHAGAALATYFPQGLHINAGDAETFNRLHLIVHMHGKLSRYAANIQRGGHQDSLDDLAVYAMLSRECDEEWKETSR